MAEPVTLNFKERRRPLIILQIDQGDYTIDPNIDVEDMGEALVAEEAVNRAITLSADTDLKDDDAVEKTKAEIGRLIEVGRDFIQYLVEQRQPDAPALELNGQEILATLEALSGRESVQAEVLTALLEAVGRLPDLAEQVDALTGDTADAEDGGDGGPLASKKRSPGSSSGSRSRRKRAGTGGGRTGGEASPGGSSGRTSRTPEPAAT
ncbi:MAG: hypothetical protein M3540_07280 [Actinomycetota bacterium]|nr:hypothetical protein [Actinomycetota bacterium]